MAKTPSNTSFIEGTLSINGGDHTTQLPVHFRPMSPTAPFGQNTVSVPKFTTYMMDKRAPGVYTAAVAGASAKLERLAELAVASGTVPDIARALMRHDLVTRVNERILRSNSKVKQGVIVISYPALSRIIAEIIGVNETGPTSLKDPLRAVAAIITELMARAYAKFGMMLPYKQIMHQAYYNDPLITTRDIINASHVQDVTEVFESLTIGAALKEKEFLPNVIEALLSPTLVTAANRLLASDKYHRWMLDAATLTGKFLRNSDEPYITNLADDANLVVLAANASFAFDAMLSYSVRPVASPVHEHSELLAHAVVRIRELRRFESVSPEKLVGMYTVRHMKTPKGVSAGVMITRNTTLAPQVKALGQTDIGGVIMPLPAYQSSPYMPMLAELISSAFAGSTTNDVSAVIGQHLIIRSSEQATAYDGSHVAFVLQHGVTPTEVQMLALATAREVLVAQDIEFAGPVGSPLSGAGAYAIHYGIDDGLLHYQGDAYYTGGRVWTGDPAEALLLQGVDMAGTQSFPARPQVYADDMLDQLITELDDDLYLPLSKTLTYQLPLADGTSAPIKMSLWNLITGDTGTPPFEQSIAIDKHVATQVASMLGLAIATSDILQGFSGPTDAIIAEQIATAVHHAFAAFTKPVGFNKFQRTATLRVMEAASVTMSRDIRADLRTVIVQHNLAMRLAVMIMMRTGLVPYGLHTDIVQLVTDANSIERAAASQAFAAMFRTRYA